MLALAMILAAAAIPAKTRQMVLVTSADWEATSGEAQRYARQGMGKPWQAQGTPFPVSLGRGGLGWGRGLHRSDVVRAGPLKKEGDGRAPAGVFALREATGYAEAAPEGTRLPYRTASNRLRCVDDVASGSYNRLVEESSTTHWTSAEDMRRADDLYRWVIWVGHNDDPPTPGGGSCIFLHLRAAPSSTTAGCTAMEEPPMLDLLRWLDPRQRPVLVQLPMKERAALRRAWGLPRP